MFCFRPKIQKWKKLQFYFKFYLRLVFILQSPKVSAFLASLLNLSPAFLHPAFPQVWVLNLGIVQDIIVIKEENSDEPEPENDDSEEESEEDEEESIIDE